MLKQFTVAVEVLERGQYPPNLSDRARAAQTLIDEICTTPWRTAGERERAQSLVHRLSNVQQRPGASAAATKTAASRR
jgi:hypothetical protein